ncbi:hypothetical protein QBC42DRAFT_224498 [Cladorrhinum samala]|uniref:Ysc84 actin-binding domain-containing protein n=1 Tax=Cladorrhinum samala TaxID=585594 RepID=A0AAV9HS41_9PEZI|nr:hypothetical protein QBC42DRAFT_224498 [Cladorrhinum samala]
MSAPENKAPADPAAHQQHFSPPPTAPPPLHTSQAAAPSRQHPDETPLADYQGDDVYNATPISEHPPQFPPTHDAHQDGSDDAKKKHKLKDSFRGYYNKAAESLTTHVGPAVNAMARKTGAEGFIAESLDKECEKAARILRAFCKDGIYADAPAPPPSPTPTPVDANSASSPKPAKTKKPRVLLTIPSKVIARAQGLAIFTAFRAGFQGTVTGGSGILIARTASGAWSPPAGIRVGGVGAGFVVGAEIYDCVVVINTRDALDLFTKTRMSLGSDLAVTAGPFGAGGSLDWGVPTPQREDKAKGKEQAVKAETQAPLSADNTHFTTAPVTPGELTDPLEDPTKGKKPALVKEAISKPVYSYVKSHGVYAGVQISGTVIIARESANARFYGREGVTVKEILEGRVEAPAAAKGLVEVLKGAEGWRGGGNSPTSPGFPPNSVGPTPGGAAPSAGSVAAVSAPVAPLTSIFGDAIPPPPPGPPPAASGKAAEAAAERQVAEASSSVAGPPPPLYSEQTHPDAHDQPPAYAEQDELSSSGGFRGPPATGDTKSGLH